MRLGSLQCNKGSECPFNHDVPCKWYHVEGKCPYRASCRFSHEELSDAEYDRWVQMEVLPAATADVSRSSHAEVRGRTESADARSAPPLPQRPADSLSSNRREVTGGTVEAATLSAIDSAIPFAEAVTSARLAAPPNFFADSESVGMAVSTRYIERLTSGTALPEISAADLLRGL